MFNILSLFDGISCAQVALQRAGIEVSKYFASEIEKNSIAVTQKHYPDTIQVGSIEFLNGSQFPHINLLIGGSPCQSLSCAAGQKESGLEKGKSTLFWEYVRVLNEVNPDYFLLENVASMKKADRDLISKTLGVEPILINSALLTAQSRKRLYWTNIKGIQQPEDKHIYLKDVLVDGSNVMYRKYWDEVYSHKSYAIGTQSGKRGTIAGQEVVMLKGYTEKDKSYCLDATYSKTRVGNYFGNAHGKRQLVFTKPVRIGHIGKGGQGERIYNIDGKSICLSANGGGMGANTGLYLIIDDQAVDLNDYETLKKYVRKLYPIECERLQTIPENYTEGFSNTARYKMIGNSFTVDVISHILSFINK
ncbi:MAG: DNA (cytosine-5-)-methyltransferase [Thermoplasmataceae archaeon]